MEKILITGTGRCGTTFLIKLFSFLNFDTGYTKDNYKDFIFDNCNSGMERDYNDQYYVLKNPTFISNIENIINDSSIKIKMVILPIRNFNLSAQSRVNNDYNTGGLWNATDAKTQIQYYEKIISNYIYFMTKYNIPTIFIDFDTMVTNKLYLFEKLKIILDEKNINYNLFCKIYDEVSITSKR